MQMLQPHIKTPFIYAKSSATIWGSNRAAMALISISRKATLVHVMAQRDSVKYQENTELWGKFSQFTG